MICTPCRLGGRLNAENNAAAAEGKAHPSVEFKARNLHDTCQAPTTCPCHHLVGTYVVR